MSNMITTTVIEDARVLIPNQKHENFTETKEIIKRDTQIIGTPKNIEGKRRGENFVYRLFLTNDNKLIYLNKIKPIMEKTEVKMGADATIVNLKQNVLAKPAVLGAIAGAVGGFAYAKYKKADNKKAAIYALVGGVVGFGIGKLVAHKAVITQKK